MTKSKGTPNGRRIWTLKDVQKGETFFRATAYEYPEDPKYGSPWDHTVGEAGIYGHWFGLAFNERG